jgi:lipopolysaccharide export system protein LptA
MPVSVARLRRWFVIALVFVCGAVGGAYFYARHRVQNALKQVPEKIGIEIQQSAHGFTISKSLQGRTLFKLQANRAVQFKEGGHAELHDVTITFYGRDSSRFDRVYGKQFEYDPQSGDVTSTGEVSIDLQANPEGILHPDQAVPKELKNPIHLKTTQVVFNKNSGDAWTSSEIEFRVPQANGTATGAKYVAREGVLTLESQIRIVMTGKTPGTILADRARLEKAPREIVLTRAHAETARQRAQADELTLFLNDDNKLDHASATGNVRMASRKDLAGSGAQVLPGGNAAEDAVRPPRAAGATWSEVTAQRLDVSMKPNSEVRDAVLSGDVWFESKGSEALEGSAARAVLDFGAGNFVRKVRAEGGVKLLQTSSSHSSLAVSPEGDGDNDADKNPHPKAAKDAPLARHPRTPNPGVLVTPGWGTLQSREGRPSLQKQNGAPDFQITSPAMDFFVADQNLTRAETEGAPEILLSQAGANSPPATRITADKFTAKFDALGQISQVHGAANVRVVSPAPPQNGTPQPDRVSTSDGIDASFWPGGGIHALVQQGHFTYKSGAQQAFADSARYMPADQVLTLNGSPRIVDSGMMIAARTFRLNRLTGEGFAEGDVKTSYSDLKPDPGGALLATSAPVHVTADNMTAHFNPAIATYTGDARLWQNANVIEAPSIQFQKDERTVIADSKGMQKVSTVLVGTDKNGNATPVTVTSEHLVYRDSERKAHFEGGVTVRGADMTVTANQMDVFLAAASTSTENVGDMHATPRTVAAPAHLDKLVASGSVVITEPTRRATGERLVYTALEDKFVLTGGPPSIFDAEHGKITAVSLTLFRRDGRVVVEGDSRSPAVTETRVVR